MQRIERYGVIALVFLLVTILAVSLWGESKGDGFLSMFKSGAKKDSTSASADKTRAPGQRPSGVQIGQRSPGERMLPMSDVESAPGATPSSTQPLTTPVTLGPSGQPSTNPDPYAAVRGPNAPVTTPLTAPKSQTNPTTTPGHNTAVARGEPVNTPTQSATREYRVKSGDTLGEIAQRELGSSTRWVDIQRLNKMIEPSKLVVGMTLVLPNERSSTVATGTPKPGAAPAAQVNGGRKYTIKGGDSLSEIASRELGSAARWTEIRDLNPGLTPENLKVGATITLPSGAQLASPTGSKPSSTQVASATPKTSKSRVK